MRLTLRVVIIATRTKIAAVMIAPADGQRNLLLVAKPESFHGNGLLVSVLKSSR